MSVSGFEHPVTKSYGAELRGETLFPMIASTLSPTCLFRKSVGFVQILHSLGKLANCTSDYRKRSQISGLNRCRIMIIVHRPLVL